MIPRMAIGTALLVQALSWGHTAVADQTPPALAPYQMVRSLQIVQDRIADGDHAALPMQKKMIEMIDKRLLSATPEEFADRRNFESLLIYGMSGGNPKTLETVAAGLKLDTHDTALTAGLIAYFKSNPGKAASQLSSLDPSKEQPQIGAFLALVKGSIVALQRPEKALPLLDLARLYAPGTLVEEAALRRSISIATSVKDRERFLRASEQYSRRFLRSPYASHFADGFINGVVELREGIDLHVVEEIVSAMNAEQQLAVYLRIARKSAIAGYTELAEFASARARLVSGKADGPEDPRAAFYNALASVTTQSIEEVARRLDAIDRSTLSKRDVRLLDAAREIVRGVTVSPMNPPGMETSEAPAGVGDLAAPIRAQSGESGAESASVARETAATDQSDLTADTPAAVEPAAPATDAVSEPDPAPARTVLAGDSAAPSATAAAGKPAPAADAEALAGEPSLDDIVSSTRKALQDIDDLLEKDEE